jgi:dihydroorotate dehydrogenase (NAD+) catalytic subunit
MIELAPFHKIGLPVANPILIATGCVGYGATTRHLLDLSLFGAWVTNPITLRPQRGAPQPRLLETDTGFILHTGGQNPGVKKVIRDYSKLWRSFSRPIIAHLPAEDPADLKRTARALAGTDTIDGLELGLPRDVRSNELSQWVAAIRAGCLLPLLLKLPLAPGPELVEAARAAQVDALVVGSPPGGAAVLAGEVIRGEAYGPWLFQLVLYQVEEIARMSDIPVIAAGGVHSLAEAQALLAAGATAVQLDTLVWRDPAQAETIAREINGPP